MLPPDGRCILVSGAGRGIGRAIARQLHALGYSVSAAARDRAALERALGDLARERLSLHRYDALDAAVCATWAQEAVARWGRIDGLVNNAGMWLPAGIEDADESGHDMLWAVNVKGPLRMVRLTLPCLKQSGAGRIVNVASLAGKRVRGTAAGYSMSKAALLALTHAIRRIGWEHGVRATSVCPSWVVSDMSAAMTDFPAAEMTQPGDFAELVAMAIALPNTAAVAELLVNCRLEDTM